MLNITLSTSLYFTIFSYLLLVLHKMDANLNYMTENELLLCASYGARQQAETGLAREGFKDVPQLLNIKNCFQLPTLTSISTSVRVGLSQTNRHAKGSLPPAPSGGPSACATGCRRSVPGWA